MTFFSANKVYNRDELDFDKSEYSRFKYGSKSIARKFGTELGIKLGNLLVSTISSDSQIVVAPSPYMFIPTATFALKNYMIASMNPILVNNNFKPVQETKVFRQTGYTADYGSMTAERRRQLIGAESFHTDAIFLNDKFVVFLDDIIITGSHQERMEEMILRLELDKYYESCMFVYFAELVDKKSDPTIEDHLNYYSMKSLLDLDKIIKNDEFIFNTRNVKYILDAPHIECINFLEYQRETFLQTLYHEAIGNSYHLETKFDLNFRYLKYLIEKK